jgi:ATP-dependent Clp protease adaptor protein ClpS|tara:strand:+ start:23570 stop:23869 length:300 start_codon:yes stop_codon:yes gene_type:complete
MTQEAVKQKTAVELRYPPRFDVIIFNDDYTPVEFVIKLLVEIFNKNVDTAKELTMTIHEHGQAVAGTYNFEIAEQKTTEALATSRASGHPLQLKTRQVE